MKHGRRFWQKQLNRTASHRRSLLRNLLTQLVYHERIETTLPKAKFMQRAADKLIESAKERTPTSIATARSKLFVPHITLPKLLGPLAVRYATRTGGYTRIHMNGYRRSGTDRAPKAIVELVDNPKDIVYALAKQRYHEVKERLSVVESRLYQKRVVQIVDPMTGEECHAIKLLDREDVRGLEKKKLVQQELGLVKLTRKFEKSLQSYPLARAAEAEHQRTVLQRFQEENAHAVEEMQKKVDAVVGKQGLSRSFQMTLRKRRFIVDEAGQVTKAMTASELAYAGALQTPISTEVVSELAASDREGDRAIEEVSAESDIAQKEESQDASQDAPRENKGWLSWLSGKK